MCLFMCKHPYTKQYEVPVYRIEEKHIQVDQGDYNQCSKQLGVMSNNFTLSGFGSLVEGNYLAIA